jgi:anti-sigma factor RsiW
MACEQWGAKLDAYLDGELPETDAVAFYAHLRGCPSCSADALPRVKLKQALRISGKRYVPTAEFRRKIQKSVSNRQFAGFGLRWSLAAAAVVAIVFALLTSAYLARHSAGTQVFSEITDLHVTTLASSSPPDVLSTDRHTVKPWFQGRLPFSFNLPELQNTDFVLVGGRMAYLEQAPGAQLIYDIRKHHISVFIFQERALPDNLDFNSLPSEKQTFNLRTWSQGGLRYFVISDTGMSDIDRLVALLKAA